MEPGTAESPKPRSNADGYLEEAERSVDRWFNTSAFLAPVYDSSLCQGTDICHEAARRALGNSALFPLRYDASPWWTCPCTSSSPLARVEPWTFGRTSSTPLTTPSSTLPTATSPTQQQEGFSAREQPVRSSSDSAFRFDADEGTVASAVPAAQGAARDEAVSNPQSAGTTRLSSSNQFWTTLTLLPKYFARFSRPSSSNRIIRKRCPSGVTS